MGLDIIPAKSCDWQESLRALTLRRQWEERKNEISSQLRQDIPGVKESGEHLSSVDRYVISRKLMAFCRENRLQYMERADIEGNGFLGDIDTGITMLEEYRLHSSYNDGGTNRLLADMGLPGFAEIFGLPEDFAAELQESHGYLRVDFAAAAENAKRVIEGIGAYNVKHCPTTANARVVRQVSMIAHMCEVFDINGYEKYRLFWSA